MLLAVTAVYVLTRCGTVCGYGTVTGMVLIALGGLSSALWGCVFQVRHNGKRPADIVKDFFRFKAGLKWYILTAVFILLSFADVLPGGSFKAVNAFAIPLLFLKAIAFGGIEELGWRYTFQPYIEKKVPYFAAALITFACWGVWHFLFFYIDGSLSSVQPVSFLFSLLTMSFLLSAIYRISGNLWLCVLAHSLINTFSQVTSGGSRYIGAAEKIVIIALSLYLCELRNNKENT